MEEKIKKFATPIPRPADIVKIDGNTVVDKDGNVVSSDLVKPGGMFSGGGWFVLGPKCFKADDED